MIIASILAAVAATTLPPAGESFVRRHLNVSAFRSAAADLNGDGRAEIFIYATDARRCGSGGCNLYVISPDAGTYRTVMHSTVTQLPVMLLATKTHGWRDIGVTVSGGGILKHYVARMRFNGRRYPSNPTMPPARMVPPSGKVLISP